MFPEWGWLWQAVTFLVSLAVVTFLFAALFKYLPDVRVDWRSVWVGAVATAALFSVGSVLLSWYIGRGSTTSLYGAFGSLVALLLWVYYSAALFYFGAELTRAYATAHGHPIVPSAGAVPLEPTAGDAPAAARR